MCFRAIVVTLLSVSMPIVPAWAQSCEGDVGPIGSRKVMQNALVLSGGQGASLSTPG
jgi:hypothetical protein